MRSSESAVGVSFYELLFRTAPGHIMEVFEQSFFIFGMWIMAETTYYGREQASSSCSMVHKLPPLSIERSSSIGLILCQQNFSKAFEAVNKLVSMSASSSSSKTSNEAHLPASSIEDSYLIRISISTAV